MALAFPGGDVALDRGVCTDVLIRAFRLGLSIDLQVVVNADMRADFADDPALWGLTRTDRTIDHRRVPDLARLLQRMGAELPLAAEPTGFRAGDIVPPVLPGNLPHLMIVHDLRGAGTRLEDALPAHPLTGHVRLTADVLARLRAVQG